MAGRSNKPSPVQKCWAYGSELELGGSRQYEVVKVLTYPDGESTEIVVASNLSPQEAAELVTNLANDYGDFYYVREEELE
jgi:hypothetical protein